MPRSQIIDVATQSLANPYGLSTLPPELYVPLWWHSGAVASSTASSSVYLQKGSTSITNANVIDSEVLHTLSTNWPSGTKFALEISAYVSGVQPATVKLYAMNVSGNSASPVSGSTITVSSTTMQVIRSGQFTLTGGQKYGVGIGGLSGDTGYITDVSLIVFPNQQLLAQGSLSNITLGTVGQKLTEGQIPLWVYSSGNASIYTSGSPPTAGQWFLQKGTTAINSSNASAGSSIHLHTLNSSWATSQKFALESSFSSDNISYTAYVALWDFTSSSIVSASQISVYGSTKTLVRSGTFTLTPGHQYGVTAWSNTGGSYNSLTKAHLVPLFT